MSKQEAKLMMETVDNICDNEDKRDYIHASMYGLRSVDFYEYFSRDHMRTLARILKLFRRNYMDKWELCEGVDEIINDL